MTAPIPEPGAAVHGSKPAPVMPTERAIAVGMPGTGKSQLLLSMWADDPGQRVLLDVQNAYDLGPATLEDEAGYVETDDARGIDWSVRTIRLVPPRAGKSARQWYEDVYSAIWARSLHWQQFGHVTVLLDESIGPTSQSYLPDAMALVLTQGRKQRIRHYAGMQRPVGAHPLLRETADHAFVFQMGNRRDDLDAIGQRFGWDAREVADALRAQALEHGYTDPQTQQFRCHAYLRHRMGQFEVHAFPPLPPPMIERAERHVINNT